MMRRSKYVIAAVLAALLLLSASCANAPGQADAGADIAQNPETDADIGLDGNEDALLADSAEEQPEDAASVKPIKESGALSAVEIRAMLVNPEAYKGAAVEAMPVIVRSVKPMYDGLYHYVCLGDKTDFYLTFALFSETDLGLEKDDNVFVTGVVKGFAYDIDIKDVLGDDPEDYMTAWSAGIVVSRAEKVDFDAFDPVIETVTPALTQTQQDVTVKLLKVTETKSGVIADLKIRNESTAKIFVNYYGTYIKQGKKQLDVQYAIDTESAMPQDIAPDAESECRIMFSRIDTIDEPFSIWLNLSSDDYGITWEPFVFGVPDGTDAPDPKKSAESEPQSFRVSKSQKQQGIEVRVEEFVATDDQLCARLRVINGSGSQIQVHDYDSYIRQDRRQFDGGLYYFESDALNKTVERGDTRGGVIAFERPDDLTKPFTMYIAIHSSDYKTELEPFAIDITLK